jgi:Xaa-Pro aminopeptidase
LPEAELVDVSNPLRQIRALKTPFELERMQQAAAFSDRLAAYSAEQIRAGMTELALAGRIEAHARKLGHQGIVRMRMWNAELFYGHLMAGAAAAVPSFLASPTGGIGASAAVSQGASARRLRPNEPILLDYVFVHEGYINDQARIFSIGALADDLMAAHEAMLKVQAAVSRAAKPGTVTGELYKLALDTAIDLGYGDHFMGADPRRIRFVGHGVGLELDEYPFLAQGQTMTLAQNMTIALEPKLIFPGRGVVGIENTHAVTPDGLRPFGRYPEQITIID